MRFPQHAAQRAFGCEPVEEQNNMIRRYIAWRNRHAKDKALEELTRRANVA